MNLRHRNKAILGLALWFCAFIGCIGLFVFKGSKSWETDFLSGKTTVAMFWGTVVAQYVFFFWGGGHLARAKGYPNTILFFGFAPCLHPLLVTMLLVLPDKEIQSMQRSGKSRSRHSHESEIARVVRFRRNALLGNSFGLFGIALGVMSVLFPVGIFEDTENETLLGILIFACGYSGVISGCWWWTKAKSQPDAIVFIGLIPLAILFIPYVRLLFLAAPGLLPTAMVMMPLVLFVIVLVLPDKSGITQRERRHR